jgi:hypothetical protein
MGSGLQEAVKLTRPVGLVPDLGSAKTAAIFIPIPIRKDEQENLSDRHRPSALGAEQLSRFELLEIALRFSTLAGGTRTVFTGIEIHVVALMDRITLDFSAVFMVLNDPRSRCIS